MNGPIGATPPSGGSKASTPSPNPAAAASSPHSTPTSTPKRASTPTSADSASTSNPTTTTPNPSTAAAACTKPSIACTNSTTPPRPNPHRVRYRNGNRGGPVRPSAPASSPSSVGRPQR